MTEFDSQASSGANPLRGDIAIIGMSCIFPGAPDLDTYWANILAKVDAVSDPPADEWDPKVFYDPASKSNDRVYCKRGGYINDLAQFRPLDFGIMPVTVDGGEPDQWLALRVAQEALADAGYAETLPEHGRTEVILGKGTYVNRGNLTVGYHAMIIEYFLQALRNLHPEYSETEIGAIKEELKSSLPPFSADTAPALIGNIIAGRIANRLDLMGPSFTVDAACASALLAIEIGVRDLLSGKCDLVLAGGANVNAPLPTMSLFCQLGALSRREQIRPFDQDADGTILGEGLGMIVLKRRPDAERDGDRIYAVVKGVGLASDGRAVHVLAPRVEGEELALRRAYEIAGLSPDTVGLIEAHGTATPVGDVVEVQALGRVFGGRRGVLPTCALGSVKSMIGHTMPAAGIAGVIKAALALYHRILPPTLHCEVPNPALQLDQTPFYINTETRPWIHGANTPRRAGVDAFGFGGINAHVVLEEHATERPRTSSSQLHWDTEVCILAAESRSELLAGAVRLRAYLANGGDAPLRDIAYTLNTCLEGKPSRLAVVAASKDELDQKLALALARLADPQCRQIKDQTGIYFFDQPLKGKLAFLFPGEGAQYANMLLDLCLHFPEARYCFDLADRALMQTRRDILPSEFLFPRSILSPAERSELEKMIWKIDGAVEGVLIGNWVMWTLLRKLEIAPDAIMGHSTGDYSAMFASKIINLPDEAYVDTILKFNRAHSRISQQTPVAGASLIAVAADSATAQSIIEAVGGELYLAMDNCPHQNVLAGDKSAAEQVIAYLGRRGIIYEVLPFDRPYHTPMFHAFAEKAAEDFFGDLPVCAPSIETYSCTTASRYPQGIGEIRKVFADHWVQPVRFTETVRKMYADGVRIFVEAGPRGNLTAFVSDILRGKRHLAMPANVARRSGLAQLNHLVGILAAQGAGMRLDYLYSRRNPRLLSLEQATPPAAHTRQPAPFKISISLPPVKVARRQPTPPSTPAFATAPAPQNVSRPNGPWRDDQSGVPAARATMVPQGQRRPEALPARPDVPVMQQYFQNMQAFLETEQQVMKAVLDRGRTARTGGGLADSPGPAEFPLLGTITSLIPGQELTAFRQLTLEEDLFLGDHALGGAVSLTDPGLKALIVLPLTMGMEILAEAAAVLMPGQVLVGMREVEAHRWITVEETAVGLRIQAVRMAGSPREVSVQIRDQAGVAGRADGRPLLEGVMVFADQYPAPPRASVLALEAEHRSRLAAADLYDGRLMFHGPRFQGVAGIRQSGKNGLTGTLHTLPAGNLFRSNRRPRLVTDPVALDAAGQLVGFWAAEYLPRGFVVFPYHLDRLGIYGPNRPVGERLNCSLELRLSGETGIRSNIEIAAADGTVWMRLEGWADRRFDPPQRFHRAWIAPREAMISEPWQTPIAGLGQPGALECCRLITPFEPGAALWKDLWASLVLSRKERSAFRARRMPERRQMEWLSGRTAAKDAIRGLLRKSVGLELLPADIEIAEDDYGRPVVRGPWIERLLVVPDLSVSHSDGVAVALAGHGGETRRFGIDVQRIRELSPDFESLLLTDEEQRLVEGELRAMDREWLLRLWSAKEAVSKALGRGLIEGPHGVTILAVDRHTGTIRATPQGKLAEAVPGARGKPLLAYTAREGSYVVASAVYEKSTP